MQKVVLLVLVLNYALASAKPLMSYPGFCTGDSYLAFSQSEREMFAIGFLDGLLAASLLEAPASATDWLVKCAPGMSNKQVTAILDGWLRANPARWQQPMNALGYIALREACRRK